KPMETALHSEFTGAAMVALAALLCGIALEKMRQPAFVGYILAGVLPGAEFAGTVVSFVNNTGREAGCGAFFMAFKVSAFMPLDTFKARMDTLIDRLHALEPAAGFDAVRVPGERGASLAAERRREGIPLAPGVIDKLGKLGADLGVTFPA
ncbi:MAG: Ldh family oxidoreductase, partial [Rhodospirillales bacterium]|nr:Ldh family oxidoreductase [Rhodospirillales bacterium]